MLKFHAAAQARCGGGGVPERQVVSCLGGGIQLVVDLNEALA